jgi:hypothetical protein
MVPLSVIPGLSPEAIGQLAACGIESVELLAGVPPVEIHRVLELTAWKSGRLDRAPTLEMVQYWVALAHQVPQPEGGIVPAVEDIPEAVVVRRQAGRASEANPVERRSFVPPAQRARFQAAGPPTPAAAPTILSNEIPEAIAAPVVAGIPLATVVETPLMGFNSFDDYQAGQFKIAPLSRVSLDAAPDSNEPSPLDRLNADDRISRWVRRGVVHPKPGLLVFGAVISLLWRAAVFFSIVAVPWLLLAVPQPSDYLSWVYLASGVLVGLGVIQLIVMDRARCRVCSCHLFFSRNCAKNKKAHYVPGIGKTASLALHLLLFQWFRCMYCGTAIKLWSSKAERANGAKP